MRKLKFEFPKKILLAGFLATFFLLNSSVSAFAFEELRVNPLQQLNQMNDQAQKQLLQENLQKELQDQNKKSVDDSNVDKASDHTNGSDLKFDVKEVLFTESTVLKKNELDSVSAEYIGKKVTLDQLYQMVNKVNEIYRRRGFVVCRAFLPEQTIRDGIIKISLVEGKTGKIKLENNLYTRKDYVTIRSGLTPGKVNNMKDLNRRVSLFNASNDAQLAVKLASGEEQGTTDYILTLTEPRPHNVYLLADNTGSTSTGVLRYGIGWSMNSMLGIRDSLSFNFVKSDFSDSGSASYTLPVTSVGTKLTASVSGNGTNPDYKTYALNSMRPRGASVSYSIGLSQPLCVTQALRIVADASWSKQHSDSWFRNPVNQGREYKTMMDNTTDKYSLGVAFTHFGRGIIWYHRHSITKTAYHNGTSEDTAYYWIYNLNFLRQQMFMNGHSLTLKLNAQLTPNDITQYRRDLGISTSDYFYIGGVGSVRGYDESQIGSEEGVNISAEYAMPFRNFRNITPILFVDYGRIFGAFATDAYKDTQLLSTGLGLRWTDNDGLISGNLWFGVPLIRDPNNEKVNRMKVHFSVYAPLEDVLAFLFREPKETEPEEEKLAKATEAEEDEHLEKQSEVAQ